jgi:hypothetical protein
MAHTRTLLTAVRPCPLQLVVPVRVCGCGTVATGAGGDNMTGKYENVGKYLSVLIMINPIIFTRTHTSGGTGSNVVVRTSVPYAAF